MNTSKKENIITNFIWRFAERCGAQIVSFLVSILLARLLLPEDYGTIALVSVFINILQVFVDSGLSTALIQKQDADEIDFSSVFYFNVLVCLVLYVIVWISSPFIAEFYKDISLIPVIRVIGITLLISGIKGIQQTYVAKNMMFKKFFFSTLIGTVISAILGVGLAIIGMGIWALVWQQISNMVIDTIVLWIIVPWRPRNRFSLKRLKKLLSFGWKLLISALLDVGYNNLRSLIIGKKYSSTDLAYYNQANKFPELVVTNVNTSIDSVLLPTMSNVQNDLENVKNITRKSIRMSIYIMSPLMLGLAFCADSLIKLLLSDKWLPCVLYLRIFCITYMFWPIHTSNLNAIKAMGRSDLFLRMEVIKKGIGCILLIVTMQISVLAMAYSLLLNTFIGMAINSWPNKKLLGYSFREQMKDIIPIVSISIFMGIIISFIPRFGWGIVATLIVQIAIGATIYLGISKFMQIEEYIYIISLLKKYKGKLAK